MNDKCYTITDKLLGKGGCGSIYLCNDQNNKSYAIKCCDISEEIGIKNILEPIIMSTISHPYLNNCVKIYASEKKLYIIQNLAMTDLAIYTRCHKKNNRPSIETLKFWCYCLIKAVSMLHDNNIIHCDIKASNILLYYDDSIKLSDFNLSILKSDKDTKFQHKICTITHRPLEVLKKDYWNESVDIWSLGCTFFEIAYGILLFPCQKNKNKSECYINSILEWDKHILKKHHKNSSILKNLEEKNLIEYNSPLFCDELKSFKYITFNDLLYNMLVSDQYKRPNIKYLLNHTFIKNSPIEYQLIKCFSDEIPKYDKMIIKKYIYNFTKYKDVIKLAIKIYSGSNFLTNYTQELKAITCALISCKILHKDIPKIPDNILSIIIKIETNICNNISFNFNW